MGYRWWWIKAYSQLCQSLQLFFCHFYSYGKAAFCLEELMMTNPHNHLYCEQYAEVSTPGFSSAQRGCWCWKELWLFLRGPSSVWPRDTMSVGKASKKEMFPLGCLCCLFRCHDVTVCELTAQLYRSSLLPLCTGEVHPRRTGKPGAGKKIFCPGLEAEQSKHEGIIWSIYGKCC